jgi:8-oxo-dGTP pyrophosphatase MutT (NUDIX family)
MTAPWSYLPRIDAVARAISNGVPVQQIGGICFRKRMGGGLEVLLVTTRRTKRWTIPKGWPILGLEPFEAVEREAWEEGGVKGRARKRSFGHFEYRKTLALGQEIPALVQVHLLEVHSSRSSFPEKGQRKLRWLPAQDASVAVRDSGLRHLLERFANNT